jgi:putative DNA primase/helicase
MTATMAEVEAAKRKARIAEVARTIAHEFRFATILESGEMLARLEGVYMAGVAESIVKREVELMEPEETNQFFREVLGHIERSSIVEGRLFDSDLDVINLRDGLYHISTGQLSPHIDDYLSRIQLPVRFNPKAAPVRIMRFLKEMLPNPDDVVNVLEDAASCLIRDARFQKAAMYIGSGNNGKSVWLGVLTALLGKENVAHESIHDLGANRFSAGNLEGRIACLFPDIASEEIKLTGRIKALIAGDRISVEKKGKQGHPIDPFAKLFFSANQLPVVADDSDAWFRRWRITYWPVQIESGKENPNLLSELTEPNELAGLFNVLAPLARRLVTQKRFSYVATIHQVRNEWGDRASVIKAFANKFLVAGPDLAAPSADVYASYVKFCLSQNFTPKKQTGFVEGLKTVVAVRSEVVRTNGRLQRVLSGVGLKEGGTL